MIDSIEVANPYAIRDIICELSDDSATISSRISNIESNISTNLSKRLDMLESKFNALLKIVEQNFPPDVELYFELYGKDPDQ